MFSLQLLTLLYTEETAPAAYRQQAVLRHKKRVVFSQPLPFPLDVSPVVGDVFSHLFPVVAEVPLDTVLAFQFEVCLLDLFQQRAVVPGRPVMDGREFGGSNGRKMVPF